MDTCHYEELEHTAEVGVRVHAPGPEALYACAARAMFSLLNVEPDTQPRAASHRLVVESSDAESLMVDWLDELLFLHETTGTIVTECDVNRWSPDRLEASITCNPPLEPPSTHIKAVTYHQLSVVDTGDGWQAEVYFDI